MPENAKPQQLPPAPAERRRVRGRLFEEIIASAHPIVLAPDLMNHLPGSDRPGGGRGACSRDTGTAASPAGASCRSELARVEAAMARIDRGDYGYCVDCNAPIELETLLADPAAAKCRRCTRRKR